VNRVRIAIAGAGGISSRHIQGLQSIETAEITAVIDVVPERAQQVAAACGATVYSSIEASLPVVDAVYILTPPSFHCELALQAIEGGKHVMIEKPLAISLEDAEAIVAAADKAKVKLMTAFNMRFRQGYSLLKKTIDSGELGSAISLWSQRLGIGVGADKNWRTTPELLCGMSIESLSHDIDLIRWLGGEIVAVQAQTLESRADLPGFDDNAAVIFSLASGASATLHASWSSQLSRNSRGFVGRDGTAMVAGSGLWESDTFHIKTKNMEHERIEVINDKLDTKSYLAESQYFLDCILEDRPLSVTGRDGLQALRISHAILTSQSEKRMVTVPTP
jgi:predicted dehydrogenase